MSERLLPDLDNPLYGPHFAAAALERLAVQECGSCGFRRWPPAPLCPDCLEPGGAWIRISGAGTVWSVAVYEHAFHPAFRDDLPYACVLVELDDGPSIVARSTGIEPAAVEIGMRVEAVFPEVAPGVRLVAFAPAGPVAAPD